MSNTIFYSYKYKCDPIDLSLPNDYLEYLNYYRSNRFGYTKAPHLPGPKVDPRLLAALNNIGLPRPGAEPDWHFTTKDGKYASMSCYGGRETNYSRVELVFVPTHINVRLTTYANLHEKFSSELGIKANKKSSGPSVCAPGVMHTDALDQDVQLDLGVAFGTRSGYFSIGKVVGWTPKMVRIADAVGKKKVYLVSPSDLARIDQDLFLMRLLTK